MYCATIVEKTTQRHIEEYFEFSLDLYKHIKIVWLKW